jgi:hypothetical protein
MRSSLSQCQSTHQSVISQSLISNTKRTPQYFRVETFLFCQDGRPSDGEVAQVRHLHHQSHYFCKFFELLSDVRRLLTQYEETAFTFPMCYVS